MWPNMELSLHGSQINLATRFKPNTPAVQYPPVPQRPWSANTATTVTSTIPNTNRCSSASSKFESHHHNHQQHNQSYRRPLSADSKIFAHDEVVIERNRLRRKAKLGSSTNILNLLLAEPIKRSWASPDCTKNGRLNKPTNNKQKSNNSHNSENEFISDNSSIEEQIDDIFSNEDDEDDNWTQRTEARANILTKNSKYQLNKIKIHRNPNSSKMSKEPVKKYVTFSNSTEVVPDLQRPKTVGTALDISKPDLPGRVSFSKNDVYEIDYSDFDNDSDHEPNESNELNESKMIEKPPEIIVTECEKDTTKKDSMINETPEPNKEFCCSLKCNKMDNFSGENPISKKDLQTPRQYNPQDYEEDSDETSKIIDSYKRSIEELNFDDDYKFNESKSSSPKGSSLSPENEYRIEVSNENKGITNEIDLRTHSTNILSETLENHKFMNSDQNWQEDFLTSKPRNIISDESDPCSSKTIHDNPSKDTSSEIINNYLKETNQKISPSNSSNTKIPNSTPKTKSSKMSQKKATVKKFIKPVNPPPIRREDTKLGEFQIDKVESWMSMHENNFHENKNKIALNNGDDSKKMNAEWRETPDSKTDDEGNYSFEDPIDELSNEGSTYNEIVSVIKEIEEQKRQDQAQKNSADKPLDYPIAQHDSSPRKSTSADSATDKMRAILSYLDDVDSSCTKTISEALSYRIPDSFRSEIEFAVEPDVMGDVPKTSELIMLPNQQLARRVVALTLRANELSNAVQLSKEHIVKVRNDKIKAIRIEKQNGQTRLAEQKKHFESIVERHQGFIEQLLKDKTILCEKVAALTRRIESQNQAWEHKLQTEIVRVKETTLAGEKIRRERWVKENTKKIKELTVKGLEQEINKMTNDHQHEITELKRQHQQDIVNAIEEARQKHELIEMGIRESYAQDREVAIEKERNAIRERFDRQMEEEQKSFEEQKNRLIYDFSNEKERLYIEIKEKEIDFERRKDELIKDKNRIAEQFKNDYHERIQSVERKNQIDIASIREQFENNFAIWKREQESAYQLREVEMENAIRQQCRMDRDKQIDNIIAKVDAETLKNQSEFDSKISRLKEKYEHEIMNLERSDEKSRELYTDVRAKLAESEANQQNLQSTLKQIEIQLNHSQKMCDELLREKEHMKDNARQEIQHEIEIIRRERDNEIERIYARVQQAIEKKDASVEFLQKENGAFKERCIKLEAIIRQQRKDYCTK